MTGAAHPADGAPATPGRGGFVIAVDGPSGTGKSTVSRRVAAALEAGYLDTGAMYRIVTLAVLRAGADPSDAAAVVAVLDGLTFDSPTDPAQQNHLLGSDDVSGEIRGAAVTAAVSPVAAVPQVRDWLLERQQRLAHRGRMVVEGRDIGTVIAPAAALKIYLTASEEVRASRRQADEAAPTAGLAEVREVLATRDRIDSTRATAPLRAAADAIVVDSTGWDVEQTVTHILQLAADRGLV